MIDWQHADEGSTYDQQRHRVLHQGTAASEEGRDHYNYSHADEDVDSNVERLNVQQLDPLIEARFSANPNGHRE